MSGFYDGAQAAMGVPGFEVPARMVMSMSQQIGDMLGFSVFTPPAPIAPLTDSEGMVFVMPPRNDPHWVTQASGLKIWDVVEGTGDPVAAGDSLTAFYTGWLAANGTEFDSRRTPDDPASFTLIGG